ncbi:MAG: PKD domain-containing protein [Euryarchaeota archaeon]|nr:PKD domain-containing protein [Euryarchaeota archaeon]MDE1836268.1 PKD domain-containing protein [Euryarchaeota archaeon]MDE1880896.1 PKD domain-containing protein [Euryarchaeota archaeon]MDE2044336.1 PKD domain-containing protein [Thermoplasmata archaeon]
MVRRRQGRSLRVASLLLLLALIPLLSLPVFAPSASPGAAPSRAPWAGTRSEIPLQGPVSIAPQFVVNFSVSSFQGAAPLNETFMAEVSGGVPPYQFSWAFGDGSVGTGTVAHHNYTSPGTYVVQLYASDGALAHASASQVIQATPPPGPPSDVSLLLLGAMIAAVLGIGVGTWVSRRAARADRAPAEPPPPMGPSPYVRTPLLPSGGRPPPFAVPTRQVPPPVATWAPPPTMPQGVRPVGGPGPAPPTSSWSTPRGPPTTTGSGPTVRLIPAPVVTVRPVAPVAARPPSVAPVVSPAASPAPSPYRTAAQEDLPDVRRLLLVDIVEGTPLIDAVRTLNEVPWRSLEEQVADVPAPQLARAASHLSTLVPILRGHLQDPERMRKLLRDIAQGWFERARQGTSASPSATVGPAFRGVFAPSSDAEEGLSLLARMGNATSALTARALVRALPVLLVLFATFVVAESITFVGVYSAFHGHLLTPLESLAVPAAVLGPPALVLCLYPLAEWGGLLFSRFRKQNAPDRVLALPTVRVASYLFVLGLAEISRAVADLVAGSLFGTPSSFVIGGGLSLVAVVAFLALLSLTIFFGWAAFSTWNLGGSRRTTWAASLLYLSVFAIWAGTEARFLVDLAQGATWSATISAQRLLTYVPAYVIVVVFFVGMIYVAFSEPEWMSARSPSGRTRAKVAQAFVDDLESHPAGASGVPLERLSDLSRGSEAPKVAAALRELFAYDVDLDRYVVLRWHDASSDTLLTVHIRKDSGGGFYALEAEQQAVGTASSFATAPGVGPSGGVAPGVAGDVWARADLTTADAWLQVLRSKKGQGRLGRPAAEVRDGPTYRALMGLLTDPKAKEARELFRKVGWTKPSGPMLLVSLLQASENEQALTPEIETDGEYLEVELNRLTGHGEDAQPFLGPWDLTSWHVERQVALSGSATGISYRATPRGDLAQGDPVSQAAAGAR